MKSVPNCAATGLIEHAKGIVDVWAQEQGVCIVPVGHRLAKKRSVKPSDFDDEPFISLTQGDGTREAVDAAFNPDRRKLILDTPYAPTICRMVEMGLGVSVVNPLVVRNMSLPGIKVLRFEPAVQFSRHVLIAQQHTESAQMTAFMQCLAEI